MLDGFLVLFLLYRKSMGLAAPTHAHTQDSGQIRPELFPVRYGSRVPARRKGGTSGMLRPDSNPAGTGILPWILASPKMEQKQECAT